MTISALDFAEGIGENSSSLGFAIGLKQTAQALRELADKVEAREVSLQSARVTSLAKHDDYTFTSVRLVFAEQK